MFEDGREVAISDMEPRRVIGSTTRRFQALSSRKKTLKKVVSGPGAFSG